MIKMNKVTEFGFIVILFIILSPITGGAPIVSDSIETSSSTTLIDLTTTNSSTTTNITTVPTNNSNSKPGGSNGGFQVFNPLNGFQGVNLYSDALRLLISPIINHYKGILKTLQLDPENSNLAASVQNTIDSFEKLMVNAANLEKAENAARNIQARNFIKSLTQPFNNLFNAF